MALSNKQTAFVIEYCKDFNATQAAIRAGYSPATARQQGARLLTNVDVFQAIRVFLSERVMSADEVMVALTEQARGDLGQFFKVAERWTEEPLPSEEILDETLQTRTVNGKEEIYRIYKVKKIVLDTDKLVDTNYSKLLHKYSDSPKSGIGIEIYSRQAALQTLAKIHGMLIDRAEVEQRTTESQVRLYMPDNGRGDNG